MNTSEKPVDKLDKAVDELFKRYSECLLEIWAEEMEGLLKQEDNNATFV